MTPVRMFLATAASAALVTVGLAGAAQADGTEPTPQDNCTKLETRLAKAEDRWAKVQVNFEKQAAKVTKAKAEKKHADNRAEKAEAKTALKKARAQKGKAADAKRAQQQRIAKLEDRLASAGCTEDTGETPAA